MVDSLIEGPRTGEKASMEFFIRERHPFSRHSQRKPWDTLTSNVDQIYAYSNSQPPDIMEGVESNRE